VVPEAQGLLATFTDPNNLTMTAKLLTSPTHGQLTLDPEGSFTCAPAAGYTGSDSFTFETFPTKVHRDEISAQHFEK